MKRLMCTICSLLIVVAGGCATAIHGRYQTITVTSNPPGARVSVIPEDRQNCKYDKAQPIIITPGEIELHRNKSTTLVAQLEGCRSARRKLKPRLSPWMLGNALCYNCYSHIIIMTIVCDIASGAWFELEPSEVHFILESEHEQ